MTLDTSTCNWESKFEVKKAKITGNENVEIVFAHIFVKSGPINVNNKTLILGPYYTYR